MTFLNTQSSELTQLSQLETEAIMIQECSVLSAECRS